MAERKTMDEKKKWGSFSETNNNGVFREIYGHFERGKNGLVSHDDLDKLRNRLIQSQPLDNSCNPTTHEFNRIDEFTSGIKYRCKKCGLEAVSLNFTGEFNKAFYGSIIDGSSFIWKTDFMNLKDIIRIRVSYGDCPIRTVTITDHILTYRNLLNWSRDGWMMFPKGFFDTHTLTLSMDQRSEIFTLLK